MTRAGPDHQPQSPDLEPNSLLVIVPTLNEAKHIERCLESLLGDSAWCSELPCIVADGGSSDGTQDLVEALTRRYPGLRLINNPNRLQSAGMNRAAATGVTAQTRFLIRCDAHATYPPGFLIGIATCLSRTGADSVVIPMDSVGQSCFGRANAWVVDTPLGNGGAAHRGGQVSGWVDHGHHAGFRRESFETMDGYDPNFSHNEDAEYDLRLKRTGGTVWLAADLRIIYNVRETPGRLARQYFNYGKGRARTHAKHRHGLKARQAIPVLAFLGCALSLILAPLQPISLLLPSAYLGLLMATSVVTAIQRRSVCGLFSGLAAGIMHMSWAAGYLVQRARRMNPKET